VVLQQNPDGLAPDLGDQLAFHSLLSHQPHRPARATFWWSTANHSHDALLLRGIENLVRAWSLLVVKSPRQTAVVVAMRDLTNRFGGKGDSLGDLRRGNPATELLQGQGAEHHPDLLNATAQ
jgi:hypothetical protein